MARTSPPRSRTRGTVRAPDDRRPRAANDGPVVDPATSDAAPWLGEGAALAAAACWVVTAMAFAAAGRRIGAAAVNAVRIAAALVLLAVIVRVRTGGWIPDVPDRSLALLLVSGVVGLALGDQLLFAALVRIGPRLGTLVATTLAPPLAALIAWPVLEERLGPLQLLGMAVILVGIAWVLLDRRPPATGEDPARFAPPAGRALATGLLLAAGGGACQAIGLVLSKLGLGHGSADATSVDPWDATLVRMAAALPAAIGLMILARRRRGPDGRSARLGPRERRIVLAGLAVGTIFGPVLGVWCSMVAVDLAPAGIAATLMATTPVLILPFAVLIDRERIGSAAIAGAVLAVAGVAMLTLA